MFSIFNRKSDSKQIFASSDISEVLLTLPFLVDGVQDGLSLGVVSHPKLINLALHFLKMVTS